MPNAGPGWGGAGTAATTWAKVAWGESRGFSVCCDRWRPRGCTRPPEGWPRGLSWAGLGWPGSGAETSEWASWRSCWLLFDRLAGQLGKPRVVIHMPAGQASSSLPPLESPRLSVSCGRWTLSWPAWITCPLLGLAQKATQRYSCVRPHTERPHCAGHGS